MSPFRETMIATLLLALCLVAALAEDEVSSFELNGGDQEVDCGEYRSYDDCMDAMRAAAGRSDDDRYKLQSAEDEDVDVNERRAEAEDGIIADEEQEGDVDGAERAREDVEGEIADEEQERSDDDRFVLNDPEEEDVDVDAAAAVNSASAAAAGSDDSVLIEVAVGVAVAALLIAVLALAVVLKQRKTVITAGPKASAADAVSETATVDVIEVVTTETKQ